MRIPKQTRQAAEFFLILEAILFYGGVFRRRILPGGPDAVSIGVALGLAALIVAASPRLVRPFQLVLKGSQFLGRILFAILAGLVYFLVLTPIALVKKLGRRPPLQVRIEPERASYYEPWEPSEDIRKQY
jgi:hypothetical protein